jgi:hypothetical protein
MSDANHYEYVRVLPEELHAVCTLCGALVADRVKHTVWHEQL